MISSGPETLTQITVLMRPRLQNVEKIDAKPVDTL